MNQWTIWKLRHLRGHEPRVHVRGATRWLFQGFYTAAIPGCGRGCDLWYKMNFKKWFFFAILSWQGQFWEEKSLRSQSHFGFTGVSLLAWNSSQRLRFMVTTRHETHWQCGASGVLVRMPLLGYITWSVKLKHPWRKYFCITVMHILAVKSCQRVCFIGEVGESLVWGVSYKGAILVFTSYNTWNGFGISPKWECPKMFWCRVLHIVSCISSRLWWGILLADFAITAFIVTVFGGAETTWLVPNSVSNHLEAWMGHQF